MSDEDIWRQIEKINRRLNALEAQDQPRWVFLTTPLTSSSWNHDSYSTTAKTLIDLSAVFSAPAGIKAVLVGVEINDSGSSTTDAYIILSPNNVADSGLVTRCTGLPNDTPNNETHIVPCDANGDIYYQILASGASTLDATIWIWGYLI